MRNIGPWIPKRSWALRFQPYREIARSERGRRCDIVYWTALPKQVEAHILIISVVSDT